MPENRPDFRYDINALRAIAVVGVVLFHYNIRYFDGGFSGVDIFFVISGYLMTRIIIEGMAKGKFSVIDFYNRRIQRIVPGLLALILLVVSLTFVLYLPVDFEDVAKNGAASTLFYSNVLYHFDDYFAAASETNIFLHTWSLSVEWQFYLILPLVLVALNRSFKNDRRKFLIFYISATTLFFLISVVVTKYYPNISFYFLPTRCWEMLIGGIAFLSEGVVKPFGKKYFYFGYMFLGAGFVMLHDGMDWPGFYTLIPVLVTFSLLQLSQNNWFLLRLPVVQFLGRISYSLYLWHWPVYVIGAYLGLTSSIGNRLGLMALAVLLGYLSFAYIESLRFKKNSALVYMAVGIAGICLVFWAGEMNELIFKDQTLEISNYLEIHRKDRQKEFRETGCFVSSTNNKFKEAECLKIDQNRPNFLLIGDSHSAHFSKPLREALAKKGIKMNQASASGCIPILRKNGGNKCSVLMNYVYRDYIPKNLKYIKAVIISANWINSRAAGSLVEDLDKTIAYLEGLKLKVVIIGQNETYTIPYASIAAREYEHGYQNFEKRFLVRKSREINNVLLSGIPEHYVDIYDLKSVPKLSADYIPYMADQNHYTTYGSILVTSSIMANPKFKKLTDLPNLGDLASL